MASEAGRATQSETGHAEPGFPPFNASTFPSQLLWFAIVFGLLYYLMSKTALPRVAEIFSIRKARIDGDLDEASRLQKEADEAHATYEKTLDDAKARAQKVAQEMRDKLAAETDAKRKSLEDNLNAKLAEAEKQIAETKSQAMTNVQSIASEAAAAILEKLTGKPGDKEAIGRAVADAAPRA